MRNVLPKDCPSDNGTAWHNFVHTSVEPGSCTSTSSSTGGQLSYLGYTVEMNPDEYPAILSRMVYRAEIMRYHNGLSAVDPPDACPRYEEELTIFFNGGTGIEVMPLRTPPVSKNTRWLLDKDELFPYQEQGSNLMAQRLTYICEGPWYIVDWNETSSTTGGTGFLIDCIYDPDPNTFMFDHIMCINQTTQAQYNTKTEFPTGWKNDPTVQLPLDDYSKTAYKQKMIKCSVKKWVKNMIEVTSPTCAIPINFAGDSIQARPNNAGILDIYVPDEAWISSRRFRMSGESFIPYSTKGGEMIQWNREYTYMCDPIFYSTVYGT